MKSLYCQASSFIRYRFIAYSVKEDGVFCLPCTFSLNQPTHGFQAKTIQELEKNSWQSFDS